MHPEILSKEQVELLPMVQRFSKKFGLVGGTAIALHLGHRRSIDFDLFSYEKFKNAVLHSKIKEFIKLDEVLVKKESEFTFIVKGVKITFFNYPFVLDYNHKFENFIKLPDLLTLAAMKAYALGRRAKWKDYVDLYFILQQHTLVDIIKRAKHIFGNEFNEKIFRVQLSYFADINYSETVEFLPGFAISDKKIKNGLIEFALN
ncbi:MAG TPA: hypothetical protein DEB09_02110 [Candidatus Magasanikbacteria bacterium]|nr:hypothetical protein [Candidatus Magasanikbacteria bacterium]